MVTRRAVDHGQIRWDATVEAGGGGGNGKEGGDQRRSRAGPPTAACSWEPTIIRFAGIGRREGQ
eukprot:2702173-Heterocapsa_arctica.AAC.1